MEQGCNSARAEDTNFGAFAFGISGSFAGHQPGLAVPVHHNVDAPFRPLVPFVPACHWERLRRTQKRRRRMSPWVAQLMRRMAVRGVALAGRRVSG
jgi:hypothetical protein